MFLRALRHHVREAWDGLWRNPTLSLLSAAAIGISLYVLGLFLLLAVNLHRFAEALERLSTSYQKAPGPGAARSDRDWAERLTAMVALVRRGGYGVGALLVFASLVTVGATVRLTVLARREEIEIMKLVGATAGFIRGPFMLAAAAQGLAGGALAVAGLRVTHRLVERMEIFRANPFMSIVAGRFLPSDAALALAAGGAAPRLVAAGPSLRRPRRGWDAPNGPSSGLGPARANREKRG